MTPVEPFQPAQADRSLGELFSELGQDLSKLVRQELVLAREEVKAEVQKASKAGGMLGAAGVLALDALLLVLFAAAWGLDAVLPTGWAFLIVAVVVAAVAGVLALTGKKQLQTVNPKPEQTIETLQEDAQWLKDQRS